ncbi:MAG: hypothetical protein LM582_09415 [Desulfurococcaceae archaeon]|nr:hypothetical protein [Desulfurococcaceae archaeon]
MDLARVLGSREGLEKVMGDVLRVLALYRRLWLTEIVLEIEGMNTTLSESIPTRKDVEKAVKELSTLGYVYVEKRLRSSLQSESGVEDLLVTLNETPELLTALANDEKLNKYVAVMYSLLRKERSQ